MNVARYRARKRGLPCTLEPEDIQQRIDAGVCELTGLPFDLKEPRAWNAPSLDRIDSTKGYTQENTRVVLYALNVMANTWGPGRILEVASAILAQRRMRSAAFSMALGESLKRQTAGLGSTLYDLTWKKLVTPSGFPYCLLRASVRRTSGIESTGWHTPTAQDSASSGARDYSTESGRGTTLTDAARLAGWTTASASDGRRSGTITPNMTGSSLAQQSRLAGWATATTRDWKGSPTEGNWSGRGTKGPPLNEQARLALPKASGPEPTGSRAATGSRGQLNPELPRWLMGLPTAWAASAPTETPSSRKSRRRSSGQ